MSSCPSLALSQGPPPCSPRGGLRRPSGVVSVFLRPHWLPEQPPVVVPCFQGASSPPAPPPCSPLKTWAPVPCFPLSPGPCQNHGCLKVWANDLLSASLTQLLHILLVTSFPRSLVRTSDLVTIQNVPPPKSPSALPAPSASSFIRLSLSLHPTCSATPWPSPFCASAPSPSPPRVQFRALVPTIVLPASQTSCPVFPSPSLPGFSVSAPGC